MALSLAEAAKAARSLPFLIDNAIRTRAVVASQAAREYAVELFMLPQAPLEQAPVPGRITQRSGKLGGSVRAIPPVVQGSLDGGSAVYTVGLEAGGETIPYAAIQELGGQTPPHVIRPLTKKVLRWQGPSGPVFALSVNHPGSVLPPRPYMGPALLMASEKLPEQIDEDVAAIRVKVFGD